MIDEVHGWEWAVTAGMPTTLEFTVEYIYVGNLGAAAAARLTSPCAPSTSATLPLTQLTMPSERLDVTHEESPMRYRTYDNIVSAGKPMPRLTACNLIEELNLASTGEPCTFAKAWWRATMHEEIDSIEQNQTWELTNLPHRH
jgi:hypothetical protein